MKAANNQALTTGWYSVALAGQGKNFKPLDQYLNPPTPADRKRALLDMFKRKREAADGTR